MNDAGGYWALGQILAALKPGREPEVTIDLLSGWGAAMFAVHPLAAVPAHYCDLLRSEVKSLGLTLAVVRRATVTLRFLLPTATEAEHRRSARSRDFECLVALEDDLGKLFQYSAKGWCEPHDPSTEQRRDISNPR